MPVQPGVRLGPYELRSLIGRGGMGEVYRAVDVRLNRPVAVKTLRPEMTADAERTERFIHEAKAASALNHPNIVTIYDIGRERLRPARGAGAPSAAPALGWPAGGERGETAPPSADGGVPGARIVRAGVPVQGWGPASTEDDDIDFIVMEYVEGKTLGELIGRNGLPLEEAMRCAVQIADALGKAHQTGIVHRDIKPSNIMVTQAGLVKVLDFGVAKLVKDVPDDLASEAQTASVGEAFQSREHLVVGTAAYMSPEQARGDRIGPASDVFSLGSLLYEMITGRRAFIGDTTLTTLAAVLRDEPTPVGEIVNSTPVDVEKFVARCLRKDPNRRFHHMMDVKLRLEELLADLQSALTKPTRAAVGTSRTETPASVAVLPFADLSQQRDQEYFCDGMTEELINALTKVEGLRVASRTSSFRFRGQAGDIRDIATRLGVTHILEGSVRRTGDRLRVTAQLINAADGYHLWSERYDRELKDVFAVQDEISQAVVAALQEKLLGHPAGQLVKRSTENLEAYDLCLRGRYHFNQWRADALSRSAELFERAIAKDPQYAAAWAGLADACALLSYWTMAPVEVWEKAKQAALKALEFDQNLAEAHSALGMILSFYEWDWQGAERALRRSVELDPALAPARTWYTTHLSAIGSFDEALVHAKRAVEIDPLSINTNGSLGCLYYWRREYERAIGQFENTRDLDPTHPRAYYYLGRSYLGARRLDEAVAVLERGAGSPTTDIRIRGILGYAYAMIGKHADAERLIAEFRVASKPGYPFLGVFSQTFVHVGLGQYDQALDCLEQLCAERSPLLHWPKVDPLYDSLRSNPRFENLLRRMGLSQ